MQFFTPEIIRSLDITQSALTCMFVKLVLCFYTEWSFWYLQMWNIL